jgi:hypothetical protein
MFAFYIPTCKYLFKWAIIFGLKLLLIKPIKHNVDFVLEWNYELQLTQVG